MDLIEGKRDWTTEAGNAQSEQPGKRIQTTQTASSHTDTVTSSHAKLGVGFDGAGDCLDTPSAIIKNAIRVGSSPSDTDLASA